MIWARNSPDWHFDDATLECAAVTFGNPDYVEVVLHSYRHRLWNGRPSATVLLYRYRFVDDIGNRRGEGAAPNCRPYGQAEKLLAAQPPITVPAITLDGLADGNFPATDGSLSAPHFTGPRASPGAGRNLPQEAPRSLRPRRLGTGKPGHDRYHSTSDERNQAMSTIITKDGTEIYYKDWGSGPVVTFSHGWPLSADAWDGQMHFLAQNGFRVVGHDRRGHGRSSQASTGNDMDGYADDLAAVIEALDLTDATLIGHSTSGGGEVARYIGRHGTGRVAKAALVSAVPPIMLKSAANPEGLPMEVFDGLRAGLVKDRSQFYRDLAAPFYGANRPGAQVSQGVLDQFWLWSMQSGLRNAYASIKAFSEMDFTEDLKKFDVPTLVLHGEDDQIVPVKDAAVKSAQLIKGAQEIYYPGAPHGLMDTHADRFNADLLAFLRS